METVWVLVPYRGIIIMDPLESGVYESGMAALESLYTCLVQQVVK